MSDKNIFAIISIALGSTVMAFAGLTAVGLCRKLERENAELRNKLAMYEGQTRFFCQCRGVKP